MRGALLVRHDAASAALVRSHLARDLASYDVPADAIEDAVLVASELVGNAIRHAAAAGSTTLAVSWDVDSSGIRVYVGDPSGKQPAVRNAGDEDPGGRGLMIVDAMCDQWGVKRGDRGKTVWAHVPMHRTAAIR